MPKAEKNQDCCSWGTVRKHQPGDASSQTEADADLSCLPEPSLPTSECTSHHSLPPEMLKTQEVTEGKGLVS